MRPQEASLLGTHPPRSGLHTPCPGSHRRAAGRVQPGSAPGEGTPPEGWVGKRIPQHREHTQLQPWEAATHHKTPSSPAVHTRCKLPAGLSQRNPQTGLGGGACLHPTQGWGQWRPHLRPQRNEGGPGAKLGMGRKKGPRSSVLPGKPWACGPGPCPPRRPLLIPTLLPPMPSQQHRPTGRWATCCSWVP